MLQYHDLLQRILAYGVEKQDRTGVGTLSVFGHQMRFDLVHEFPLITTKELRFQWVAHELLRFLAADSNLKHLGVPIWNQWPDANDERSPAYDRHWRIMRAPDGEILDQITKVIDDIRRDPDSRRLIVPVWHPTEVDKMALPPCHCLFQFYVAKGRLSCQVYQRSADVFIRLPFDIASYALLTSMIAQVTGLKAGELVHTLGDAHLCRNHLTQARLQLSRLPRPLPKLTLAPAVTDLFAFRDEHCTLRDYDPHPYIKAEVAV